MKPTRLSPTSHHWPQKTGSLFSLFSSSDHHSSPVFQYHHLWHHLVSRKCISLHSDPYPLWPAHSLIWILPQTFLLALKIMSSSQTPAIFLFAYLLHETRPPLHQMDSWEILSRSSCLSFVYFLPLNWHSTWRKVELFPVMSRPQKIEVYRKEHVHPLPIFVISSRTCYSILYFYDGDPPDTKKKPTLLTNSIAYISNFPQSLPLHQVLPFLIHISIYTYHNIPSLHPKQRRPGAPLLSTPF